MFSPLFVASKASLTTFFRFLSKFEYSDPTILHSVGLVC